MRIASLIRLTLLVAATALSTGKALAADSAAPATITDQSGETPAATAARVLPTGAVLAHPPVRVAFGSYKDGVAVLYRASDVARGIVTLYVAPAERGTRRVVTVHVPADSDEFFDTTIRAVLAAPAPGGGSDLVILTHVSRPAISGGLDVDAGEVYRMAPDGRVSAVPGDGDLLDGVKNAAEARKRLAKAATSKRSSIPASRWAMPLQLASAADRIGIASDAAVDAEGLGVRGDFIALPNEVTGNARADREALSAPGSTRLVEFDRANGFLQISGDGALPGFVVARFKGISGPVIGVTVYYTAQQRTRFFVRDAAEKTGWREVTMEVVPGYDPVKQYTLPHHGTTLVEESVDGTGRATLAWKGEHFERAR